MERQYRRVCEFAERYVAPRALEIDRRMMAEPDYVPWDLLEQACEYRIFSGLFPAAFGGPGDHLFSSFITQEIIATYCVGIANLLAVNGLAIGAVMAWFDPRALAHIAEMVCSNERKGVPVFLSTCVTEPGAGSDAEDPEEFAHAKLSTIARRVAGGYRITGTKVFISNGALASLHVVVAYADQRHRPEDALLLLVPRGSAGLSVTRSEKKMGQKVCPASEVVFDDVFVPDDMVCRPATNLEGGAAAAGLANVLGMTRAGVGGFATGVAEGAYRTALRYCREHNFMGLPMERQQWVRVELADMAMRAQIARSTYLGALLAVTNVGLLKTIDGSLDLPEWAGRQPVVAQIRNRMMGSPQTDRLFKWLASRQTSPERDLATAMGDVAKAGCSDLAMENCQRAVSLMGKDGVRHEFGAEKLLRDVKLLQIYEGTNQINRLDYIKRRVTRQFDSRPSPQGRA
jgi:alkylation response protein AidB-like acyl-CoA dehydrogenase